MSVPRRGFRLSVFLLLLIVLPAVARDPLTEPPNGPRRAEPEWHALVGATVHVRPGTAVEEATVVVRDGRIVSVVFGKDVPPDGARIWRSGGLHVYAGFIDAYVEAETPRPPKGAPGEHFNPLVTPRRSALDGAGLPEETAKELREMGFCAAAISPKGGIFRGRSAVVSLAERRKEAGAERPPVYLHPAYQAVAFETGHGERAAPTSEMGAIAIIRQTLLDADWRAEHPDRRAGAVSIDVLAGKDAPRLLIDTRDELQAHRALAIGRELDRGVVLLGSGLEFRRLRSGAWRSGDIALPLSFPKKPKVASVGDAEAVSLRELMTWEQAPTNPRRLDAEGIRVALTTAKLEKRDEFPDRLRKAIRHGLSEERALAMLTTHPAGILGLDDSLGTVEGGKIANLVVTDGPIFAEETRIRFLWVDGRPHEIRPARYQGTWSLATEPEIDRKLSLGFDAKDEVAVRAGEEKVDAKASVDGDRISLVVALGESGRMVLSGTRTSMAAIEGDGTLPDGRRITFSMKRISKDAPEQTGEEAPEEKEVAPPEVPERLRHPLGAYSVLRPPRMPALTIVKGATLWTSAPAGIVENGVLVVSAGNPPPHPKLRPAGIATILYAGPAGAAAESVLAGLSNVRDRVEIDATGKHVTPGIIDAHSHTGASGDINESGEAVSAEVRIADITNPDDINWYRQLAGGVTAALTLHGSANPIGGQSQVQKLRWGVWRPDMMHMKEAPSGIKFALGENVKQSNWGDKHTTRYPQTRMGVETLMRDRFLAAREYARSIRAGEDVRRDLELEALAEVLGGERLVHCHSYRQDEILMLCKLAGEFGFRVGTFTHVLEGYKVAEALKAHAIGASCFSDWWAYKVEVQDAIPWNGALMHETGVLVSFNSDSGELARRLNVEAAKAVKYGGVPPEEALKFVTLNPARQLKIDHLVGSLEAGKHGDFAIWSGSPLSTMSRCESTWIDGREYFSLEMDRAHRKRTREERRRIIQKVLASPDEEGGGKEKGEKEYRCSCTDEGGDR